MAANAVEAVPHIRDEIVRRFEHAAKEPESDISIIEIGGTVGDYQNIMFIEAARLLKIRHPDDVHLYHGFVFAGAFNSGRDEDPSDPACRPPARFIRREYRYHHRPRRVAARQARERKKSPSPAIFIPIMSSLRRISRASMMCRSISTMTVWVR